MKNPKGSKGKWLEEDIRRTADHYRDHGFLRVEKVDPPTRVVYMGKPPKPVAIQLPNPFLDFVGTWTEAGGRAIFLEAKSTQKPSLMICQEGGITEKQWTALNNWHLGGAAAGVLWGFETTLEIRFVPLTVLAAALASGKKSIRWEAAPPLKEGLGFVRWDWLAGLREAYPRPVQTRHGSALREAFDIPDRHGPAMHGGCC